MRARLLALLLLLSAPSAAAHFHEGLVADEHAMRFRWSAGAVMVAEQFRVTNAGAEAFRGRVYAWLPEGATVALFGPEGAPPVAGGGGLVAYDLGAANRSLAPGEGVQFGLSWSTPLPERGTVERRLVYATRGLRVEASPPLVVTALPPPGAADFEARIAVAHAPPEQPWGLLALAALAAALLAGAWWWDRRRRR